MRALAVAALLTACTTQLPDLPSVRPVLTDTTDGIRAWEALGFSVTLTDTYLPECARHWYDTGEVDCQITIGVVFETGLRERVGSDASADRLGRGIYLDTRLEGFALLVALAHESGHVLLDTPRHTVGGVMGGADVALAPVDFDLACETIHVCR